jgi:hypothetical protein
MAVVRGCGMNSFSPIITKRNVAISLETAYCGPKLLLTQIKRDETGKFVACVDQDKKPVKNSPCACCPFKSLGEPIL